MRRCLRAAMAFLAVSASLGTGAAWAQKPTAELPPPGEEVFQQDVAWSPDGRWIAYSEYAGGETYDAAKWAIHVIGADGSGGRRVVENAQFVSWSPDGERLAFGSGRGGNWNIYLVGIDGSGLERLTDDEAKDVHPAWSPRGDRIAFVSDRDGNREIYLMASDGSGVTRLTDDPASEQNPSWSPDGTRIVFFRETGDGMDQIRVVAADGSTESAITRDRHLNTFPSFLPGGDIAFTSKPKDGEVALVRVAPDGTDRRRVGSVETFFARWSPDGERVAFISGRWPKSAIYLMNADGTGVRKLVN